MTTQTAVKVDECSPTKIRASLFLNNSRALDELFAFPKDVDYIFYHIFAK